MTTTAPPFGITVPEDSDPVASGAAAMRTLVAELTAQPLRGAILGRETLSNGSGAGVAFPGTIGPMLGDPSPAGPIVIPPGVTGRIVWDIHALTYCASASTGQTSMWPQYRADGGAWTDAALSAWGAIHYYYGAATQSQRRPMAQAGFLGGMPPGSYEFRVVGQRSDSFAHTAYLSRFNVSIEVE